MPTPPMDIDQAIATLTRQAELLKQRESELRQSLAEAGLTTQEAIDEAYESMDASSRQAARIALGIDEAPGPAATSPVKRKISRMI